MIDLRQFIALKAVSQTKSIARAAENLGWSQPTVNYHLNNLEAELGAPLLNRTKRGSELTPVAQQLVPKIEEILVLCERSINEAKTTASETSTPLRFGIFPTAAAHLLPGITASLSKTKYKVQATLEEVALLVSKLQKREIDAALSYTTPNVSFAIDSNFAAIELFDDPVLLGVPKQHPLARFAGSSVAPAVSDGELLQTVNDPWIVGAAPGDPLDENLLSLFRAHDKQLNTAIHTDDYTVALGLIAAGAAIGLIPALACSAVPANVVLRPIANPVFKRKVALLAPNPRTMKQHDQQRLSALVGAVKESATRQRSLQP